MGLFSGLKKVFKKVTKVLVKVAPIALLAGAAIFTGGAALGLAPFAGGWGAAAAGFASNLGLTGTLGSVVTGAVTQAGYGALIGGGLSAATGGSFIKGAQLGALTGTVTGGLTGGFNALSAAPQFADHAPTGFSSFNPSTSVSPISGPGVADLTLPVNPAAASSAASSAAPAATGFGSAQAPSGFMGGSSAAAPAASSATGFGSFLDKEVVGRTLAGLGQGYLQGQAAKDEQDLQIRLRDERQASYDIDPSVMQQAPTDTAPRPTPREAYGARRAAVTSRYAYNPETNRIERTA